MHVATLTPEPGERSATFGGTRSGKSGLGDMQMFEIQAMRPACMQALVDTKPRYRAETERGRHPSWRKSAAYRYQSWAKGPTIPNSVVVDLWSDHPLRGLWERPGEIAIFQSGDANDWKRILALLDAFVKAEIKGRERRIIADECLDFTNAIHGALTLRTMCIIARPVLAANETSALTYGHTVSTECPRSSSTCSPVSHCSISSRIPTCDTYGNRSASWTQNPRVVTTCSANGRANQGAQFRGQPRAGSYCRKRTYGNCPRHRRPRA